ncbi:penicillin-binding transpeptidase domain-containing protein [Paenibacillus tarimensis]
MIKRIKLRTLMVGGLITLLFVVLAVRIYFVQVVKADFYLGKARETWAASETLPAVRGTITDRDGNILAMDAGAYTVAVGPQRIHELNEEYGLDLRQQIVSTLHTLLGKSVSGLEADINAKRENGDYLVHRQIRSEGWKIDKEHANQVSAFIEELRNQTGQKNVGIYLEQEQKRYYPKEKMASHLLGYVDKDGKSIYGLEKYFDDILRGENGYIKYEKDGNRLQLERGEVDYKPAVDGKKITLTINTEIQYYVEAAIKEAYEKYRPKSITAIAADPKTMEILGMANYPNYDPNEYWDYDPESFTNHAIVSLYEPGSTFKIVTLAGAVEEGLFNPDETYKSGEIFLKGFAKPIRDHIRGGWGPITFLEGLKYSSNVAFVKLGYEKLGTDKLRQYITDFGFGQKTGIELRNESTGVVSFYYPQEVASATFGQGVSVTPIQQVAAIAAIANGGKLLEPRLVKKIEDPAAKTTETFQPKVVRQVISEKTAKQVGEYLEQVVSDREIGTGRNAYIEGYRVAGKTGTAQKVVSGKKGYAENKYVVSFIGFAPVEDPEIVVYVVVDEPDDPYAGGGSVAAPVFKKIVQQSLRHLGVLPSATADVQNSDGKPQRKPTVEVPDLTDKKTVQAENELKQRALSYEVVGKGATVIQQIPEAGTIVPNTQRVYIITEERKQMAIPNMIGLPLRDALEVCSLLDMRCVTDGEGYVTSQSEQQIGSESVLKITLHPPGVVPEEAAQDEGEAEGDAAADEAGAGETDGEASP